MNGILDLINSDMGQQLISGTVNQMGLDKNTTSGDLSTAIPLILGAMKISIHCLPRRNTCSSNKFF